MSKFTILSQFILLILPQSAESMVEHNGMQSNLLKPCGDGKTQEGEAQI
jgi:hypothetical protein